MAGISLQLPTIQNWSCHNCSGCCRQHAIEITDEELERIERQNWSEADGIPADQPLTVPLAKPSGGKRFRLAHQPDGACVFLQPDGLCRIHAKFGEPAKPLPCRIYPYAFHPSGSRVTVSLRFSCPSVVANRGTPVAEQSKELQQIARLVVPRDVSVPPPKLTPRWQLDWKDTLRFVSHLDRAFADPDTPVLLKLRRVLYWMRLIEQSRFDKIHGAQLEEYLTLITQAAEMEVNEANAPDETTGRMGRMQFRLLAAQYARKDTAVDLRAGWKGRWKLLRAAVRFARGKGNIPALQDAFRGIPFAVLEHSFGPVPQEAEETFNRYLRVKIQGLHFFGAAYYQIPFVEGFHSLALIYPAILWLARWLAASDGRNTWTIDDIQRAITIADHHHGYSPMFGTAGFRRRVRMLAHQDDIERLCCWYARG